MRRLKLPTLAVWLLPLCVSAALAVNTARAADAPASASAFSTPDASLLPSSETSTIATNVNEAPDAYAASQFAAPPPPYGWTETPQARTRFESVRYRPRRYPRDRDRGYYNEPRSHFRGVSQLHAGFLDPEGPNNAGFLVGFRGGQRVDEMLELGLGIDWRNKSGRATEVLQETTGPGGETIVVSRELNRFSSNLFPVLAYIQLSAPADMGIVPYFGAAGSYQALFLSAEDSQTGEAFDATYDGFGWQIWGGAAIPLQGSARLVGEIFLNRADLSRDVRDPITGETFRETVSTDGVGGRFGINWGF